MTHTFDLSKRVIAITGGYGHLGKGIVECLLKHGATVWVLGRNQNKHTKAFAQTKSGKERLFFQHCDISQTSSIKEALESVFHQSRGLDVIINNAFYTSGNRSLSLSDEDWRTTMDGTLSSVFRCIREAIPYLRKSEFARIINVASTHGMMAADLEVYSDIHGTFKPPDYGVAKAGVIQLTKYYASYLGKEGITVNTVTPGPFPADRIQENQAFVKKLQEKTLLKRIGKPEEIGGAFVFLASDASSYITGQNIVVDGGLSIL